MANETIKSLADFTKKVVEFRDRWRVSGDKELWFRGEDQDFGETKLVPKLHRPRRGQSTKPVPDLLEIENRLYDEFSRLGLQLCEQKIVAGLHLQGREHRRTLYRLASVVRRLAPLMTFGRRSWLAG